MKEEWKDIDGYEGIYQVSNLGRIKSLERDKIDTWGRTKHTPETIMKQQKSRNGYMIATLWKDNKNKKHLVHRLVAQAFIENPNGYKEINHKDENKENNNVSNLEWCTKLYNMNYGTIKEKMSKVHKGKTPWNKGRKVGDMV